jgi:membrane protein YdbS with pleckstrin-like domain
VWEPLPPNARFSLRLFTALGALLPALPPATVLALAWDALGPLPLRIALWLAVLLLAAAFGAWWGGRRWARTAFLLDAGGLRIRRGIAWRSETLVPRSRVQHTDLNRGPLDRRLGLATLKVYTAGTKLASVSLDGLPEARALELRDALVNADDDAV